MIDRILRALGALANSRSIVILMWAVVLLVLASVSGVIHGCPLIQRYTLVSVAVISFVSGASIVMAGPAQVYVVMQASEYSAIVLGVWAGAWNALGEMIAYYVGLSVGRASGAVVFRYGWLSSLNIFARRLVAKRAMAVSFVFAAIPNPIFEPLMLWSGYHRVAVCPLFCGVIMGKIIRFSLLAYLGGWLIDKIGR